LEQYNSSPTLDTKSCKDNGRGVGLSFRWGAFGIEGMVGEKMVSTSFDGAASHGEQAPGSGTTHARIALQA